MDIDKLYKEVSYKAVTSSGPGGQHVNKVATKVVLEWYLFETQALSLSEYNQAVAVLKNKLTSDGRLVISSQQSRSQASNKEYVFEKLINLLLKASKTPKKRLKRTTPAAVKKKRLNEKKKHSEKKENRRFRL